MRAIHQPRGRMPIAPYAMIPETPDGRNRMLAGSARQQGPGVEIILQRFRLTPGVSLFGWRLAVSPVQDSPVLANTTTRRQEVDESWTDFNLRTNHGLGGMVNRVKLLQPPHCPIGSVFEQKPAPDLVRGGYRFAFRKCVKQV